MDALRLHCKPYADVYLKATTLRVGRHLGRARPARAPSSRHTPANEPTTFNVNNTATISDQSPGSNSRVKQRSVFTVSTPTKRHAGP